MAPRPSESRPAGPRERDVALIRDLNRGDRAGTARPTPAELLAERYARGEIDEAEYRRRLDVVTQRPRPPAKRRDFRHRPPPRTGPDRYR